MKRFLKENENTEKRKKIFPNRKVQIVTSNHLHDFDLSHAGDSKGDTLSRLNHLTHRVECHHFERQLLDVCNKPPGPGPSADNRALLRWSAASSWELKSFIRNVASKRCWTDMFWSVKIITPENESSSQTGFFSSLSLFLFRSQN